ncbi:hypothetical protein TNCV_2431031 [Trichonephila clavipes]|nr:hypothetical protein TNCV_2431031 [Trichonephila clavipes]
MQSEHHDSLSTCPQGSNDATECCICLNNDDSERYISEAHISQSHSFTAARLKLSSQAVFQPSSNQDDDQTQLRLSRFH